MQDLPNGLVRLIGRYWELEKEYKVKLKATSDNQNGELEIMVIKPDKLGDNYGKAKDVFDQIIDMDLVIITNAGKYGIPPQLIKAQIDVEAAKKNFGGNIGMGYAPSYRYEPYTAQFWKLKECCSNYFFNDSTSNNFSDIPNHSHVLFKDYYREFKTVWEIIKEESQLVDISNSNNYGTRTSAGKMDFGMYTSIQKDYNSIYSKYDNTPSLTSSEKADSARINFINYFKKKWKDEGAQNIIAQTRVASSYGLLQMMYSTAIGKEVKYSKEKLPEEINEQDFFIDFIEYQKKKISEKNSLNNDSNFNWKEGFELTIRNSVFKVWNSAPTYPETILKRVNRFLPTKND